MKVEPTPAPMSTGIQRSKLIRSEATNPTRRTETCPNNAIVIITTTCIPQGIYFFFIGERRDQCETIGDPRHHNSGHDSHESISGEFGEGVLHPDSDRNDLRRQLTTSLHVYFESVC